MNKSCLAGFLLIIKIVLIDISITDSAFSVALVQTEENDCSKPRVVAVVQINGQFTKDDATQFQGSRRYADIFAGDSKDFIDKFAGKLEQTLKWEFKKRHNFSMD